MEKQREELKTIVTKLAEEKQIEKMVFSVMQKQHYEHRHDIVNDILIYLLEHKDPQKIIDLYSRNELGYFILGIIKNQLWSRNSKTYSKYLKWDELKQSLDYENDTDETEEHQNFD